MAGLTSVPLAPQPRWWTKLARFPHRLWSMSGEIATALTDRSPRQPSRRKVALIRIGVMALFIPFVPLVILFSRWSRPKGPSALDALVARVSEMWKTSPDEAVALLRSTFEKLIAKDAYGIKSIELEPFGKFEPWDALRVQRYVYDCHITLGRYEDALAVAAAMPGGVEEYILQQVDCLVALGRGGEAVALLERNLEVDGWRGTLRRRLRALGGRDLRSLD